MKLYINGLTIEGNHCEMMDFVELRAMRQPATGVMPQSVPNWKADHPSIPSAAFFDTETARKDEHLKPIQTPHNLRGMKIETVPAGTADAIMSQRLTPVKPPSNDAKKPCKPLPPVKHTDVVPADAPVTVVPTGVSGRREKPSRNGMTSRIRFAIFNGKTTRAALMKALSVDAQGLHNVFYSLVKIGHVEPVAVKKGRLTQDDAYRLTEVGLSYIESDKKKLIEMGILKA